MTTICIYHGNCADGFTAAWVVHRYHDNGGDDPAVEFHPGVYGEEPPDVSQKHVIIVDFSYKRDVLIGMAGRASSLLILDHHKTARDDLEGLPLAPSNYEAWLDVRGGMPLGVVFDMERSGAGITWDFFYETSRPQILDHVEDRDLYRFKLPWTRQIQAAVFSYPYDFEVWDWLMDEAFPKDLIQDGRAIERKHHKDIDELLPVVTRNMCIGGQIVPAANLPYVYVSDAANRLAQDKPFAACYWDTPRGRCFGLRSVEPHGVDVSEVAKRYGGGGHKNASGFTVAYDKLEQFEIS